MAEAATRDSGDLRRQFSEALAHVPGLKRQKTRAGETFLVSFDGPDDEENPQNWAWKTKILTSIFYGLCCVCSTFASGILSPATLALSHRFHISPEVSTLSTSTLYLLGYVAGPFAWAPISETRGRKLPMAVSMFGFICFGALTATAKDYQTLAVNRFFQGTMGACSVTITTAAYADMFNIYHRGYATTAFAFMVFSGPMLAAPIGGFTVMNSSLGWRWNCWWTVFTGAGTLFGLLLFSSESYAPYILKQKAIRLRVETGEWAIHSKIEERHLPIQKILKDLVRRPFQMTVQEPILLLISIYTAFVYALLYTFLVSYGIVFHEGYGMNPGVAGLPIFGLMLGLLIAALLNINQQRYFNRWVDANNGVLVPEWRMPIGITGAIAFPVGLFWFAWTANYPNSVHWIVPTVSGLVTGYGLLMIFMSCFTYLIDVYKTNSASAFAAATIIRSALAAGFPMFATQMFHNLGVERANTLLALLALVLVPVPVCFWIYGAKIRARSRFVPDNMAAPSPAVAAPASTSAENHVPEPAAAGLEHDNLKEKEREADREFDRQLSGESNWLGNTVTNDEDDEYDDDGERSRRTASNIQRWISRASRREAQRERNDVRRLDSLIAGGNAAANRAGSHRRTQSNGWAGASVGSRSRSSSDTTMGETV